MIKINRLVFFDSHRRFIVLGVTKFVGLINFVALNLLLLLMKLFVAKLVSFDYAPIVLDCIGGKMMLDVTKFIGLIHSLLCYGVACKYRKYPS